MKDKFIRLTILLIALFALATMARAQGTAFTYQGRLTENGVPSAGVNDLTFTLYAASSGGATVGTSNVFNDVAIAGGLFTVTLDFGASAFDGNARWLEIAARPGASTGTYTPLTPRQPLTATPYAVRAANFSGTVAAGQLPPNIARLDGNQTFSGSVQLTNPANVISGNGFGLTNLNFESLGSTGTVRFSMAGRFEPPILVTVGGCCGGDVSVADVNSDGLPDFLLARGVDGPIAILTQPKGRSFSPNDLSALVTSPARDYRALHAGDLNGDGRPDLVAYDAASRRLYSFLAGATFPSFAEFSSLTFNMDVADSALLHSSMALGDINGDGRPDIAVANPSSNVVFVVTNQVGNLLLASTLTVGLNPRNVALGDINRDGRLDLVTANRGSNNVTVATNAGGGRFAVMNQLACTNAFGLVLADFNGDGHLDVAAASDGGFGEIKLWTNGAFGQLTSSFVLPVFPYNNFSLAAGDFNGDGAADLLASHAYLPSVAEAGPALFPGTRDGRLGPVEAIAGQSSYGSTRVFAADLDQNGRPDISIAYGPTRLVRSWLNESAIDFSGIVTFDDRVVVNERLDVTGETILSGPTEIRGGVRGSLSVQGDIYSDGAVRYPMSPGAKWGQDLYNGFGISYGIQQTTNSFYPNVFYFRTAPDFLGGAFAWYIGGYWREVDPGFDPSSGILGMTLDTNGLSIPRSLTVGGDSRFLGTTRFESNNRFLGTTRFESNIVFSTGSATFSNQVAFAANAVVQPPGALSFGTSLRQMINLFDASYGLGVQNSRLYFRGGAGPNDGFAWFKGGSHSDATDNPGPGGSTLMTLNANRLFVNSAVGLGTTNPAGKLHLYSTDNPTTMRIQSTGTPGLGRIEFVSNPQGDPFEWRPGYIQSLDAGGFTGGLGFFVNGTGAGSRFGDVEVMRVVNGNVAVAPTAALSFGAQTRQMINLWGTGFGIGVQSSTLYSRCNAGGPNEGFAWYKGGVHSDSYADAGGGVELMHLVAGGLYVNGAFVAASDRNAKENFEPINSREVLDKVAALPLSKWNYKADPSTRHVGVMAQDFYAAFGVGPDDKHIATVDADGVALAAIQGLNQKLEAEVKAKDARINELEKRLSAIESLLKQ